MAPIYSDGEACIEKCVGSCASIVNTNGCHNVATLPLKGEKGKNSYWIELGGIYLGANLAIKEGISDKEFHFYTDNKSAIYQFQKEYLSTGDVSP